MMPPTVLDQSGPGRQVRSVAWARGGALWAENQVSAAGSRGRIEAPGRWSAALAGAAGPLAAQDDLAIAIELTSATEAEAHLFSPATGPQSSAGAAGTTRVPLRASEYVVVADVAVCDQGAAIAGSFGGALRVGDQVVSTGGQRDGFVARLDGRGAVRSLTRMGGDGDDGFAAVACRGEGLAVAGTFSARAELRGAELPRMVTTSPYADAVLVMLRGDEVAWTRTFGGGREELVADVAITERGEVAVVGSARDELAAGDVTLEAHGLADGYLARWSATGEPRGALRLGGPDYDGASQVVALGDRLVVGGFFTGSADVGGTPLVARGGDDAMLVVIDQGVPTTVALAGDGREEIVSMARAQDGLVMAVAHTAGFQAWSISVPAPADPLGGVAILTLPSL